MTYLSRIEHGPPFAGSDALWLAIVIEMLRIHFWGEFALTTIALDELNVDHRVFVVHRACSPLTLGVGERRPVAHSLTPRNSGRRRHGVLSFAVSELEVLGAELVGVEPLEGARLVALDGLDG